ncbi:MAG: DUF4835 family protein [Bacteroidaceae bacterium]|nr:DUF4835 family protein [Bacteroidaceae bacterium]MBR1790508.1 DUF4835 family protein [Bacteroidaceae bacterium]
MKKVFLSLLLFLALGNVVQAQELNARVMINREQVSNTKSGVFDALEKQITQFLNERKWTDLQFRESERIQCAFNLTISAYSETDNSFKASLLVASNRPVWGSSYTTTVWNYNDKDFNFNFQEFDQLEWRPEQIDNNLTAMLAYWIYFIIGMDLDTMSPKGGTPYLQMALDICNNAESLGSEGWKAFGDTKNRFSIVNDYLDGAMEKMRQLQYDYYRKGLDQMSENTEKGRDAIAETMTLLKEAHEDKSLSLLPQIFTDIKRDEIISIFNAQTPSEQRESIYEILFRINPSQSQYWDKLKQ